MTRPIEGAIEKFGRCFFSKSARSANIDTQNIFTIISQHIAYVVGCSIANLKYDLAWFFSAPVYMQNMHVYHVYEDDSYIDSV